MKKLMALVLSVGLAALMSGLAVAAGDQVHELAQINAPGLVDAVLSEVVGTENIMHAGMAEVLSDGVGGSGAGGGGIGTPYLAYELGKAAYAVGSRAVKAYRAVDKAIEKATGAVVKWAGRTAVARKVWDWFHRNNDDR